VPPSARGCRGTMIVGKENVDLYGAPTLHYVRSRPPRACLVLSVFYEHGVAPCGGIISDISSRTEKSREKKIRGILTSFFRVRKLLYLSLHRSMYCILLNSKIRDCRSL